MSNAATDSRNQRKSIIGFVTSRSGDKSVKVTIPYKTPHPRYRLKRWRVLSVIESAVGATAEAITEADVAATVPTKTTRPSAAAPAEAPAAPTA
jgi:small subunit ribosomal protein S17